MLLFDNKAKQSKIYPLIPPQEMILYMLTHSLHKQVTQIPDSVLLDEAIDFSVLAEAVNIEIERNDCMRLRFIRKGTKTCQYFLPEYHLKEIPLLVFKTEKEQTDYFTADAQKPIRYMRNETYRIRFFKSFDGRHGIYINVHHVVMDNAACFVFFNDLLAVYDSLKYGKPMPAPLGKFEDRIQKELAFYADGEAVKKLKGDYYDYITKTGEPLYLGVEGTKTIEKARKLHHDPEMRRAPIFNIFKDKAEFVKRTISPEVTQKAVKFMEENEISGECLVQLAMRLHLSAINFRHNETFFVVLCPRRRTKNEKRSGGNVTSALPWRLVVDEKDTFFEALRKLQQLQAWIFRHMDFPFIDYRNLECDVFKYNLITSAPSMMFSWMPIENNSVNGYSYEYRGYDLGRYCLPLYTFAMKDVKNNCIRITYLHRTHMTSVEDIDLINSNTERIIEWGVDDPQITVGEIYDRINGIKTAETVKS